MSTNVYVNSFTHSVAYVTDKMLYSLKWIIIWSGLEPTKLTDQWETLERGIKVWLQGKHLEKLILEVYNPFSGRLVGCWEFEIEYDGVSGIVGGERRSGSSYATCFLIETAS